MDQVTALLLALVTAAEYCCDCPPVSVIVCGETEMVGAFGISVMVAMALADAMPAW
jgi:hypothetical protein